MPGLPNLLSLLRIALIPFLVYCLTDTGPVSSLLAAGIFFIASLTDYFDGYLARRQGRTTILGTFLDPLADKLVVMAALIMLTAGDRFPRVPAWMVVVIIGREIAVTALRSLAAGEGLVVPAEQLGKYKTFFQMCALHGLLIHYPYGLIDFHLAGMYFLWIALALGVWSGIAYHTKVGRYLIAKQHPDTDEFSEQRHHINA
jgi:CDP-diacylglycerol--glycerol-3-phosphate 3-phosphatidyltransferase